jgi:hypothetical protein
VQQVNLPSDSPHVKCKILNFKYEEYGDYQKKQNKKPQKTPKQNPSNKQLNKHQILGLYFSFL